MGVMLFRSTNRQSPPVNLREALLQGQAPDRGLYMPVEFPQLSRQDIAAFADLPYAEIAFRVLRPYVEGVLAPRELEAMCRDAYDFELPLEPVAGMERVYCLRLDCGP
ncbi:MAG: threonine synthase, partial [Verrucomicrobiae bacterium]|nr:threonine synthase [Verrucomicrobiae bacterium]